MPNLCLSDSDTSSHISYFPRIMSFISWVAIVLSEHWCRRELAPYTPGNQVYICSMLNWFQFILLFLKRNCKPFCGYNKYMYNDYKFFSFKANECISVTQMWIIKGNLVNCFVQIQWYVIRKNIFICYNYVEMTLSEICLINN